ncbi:MAG: hypothetical protein ACRD3J_06730 [Thermoanaerobaculia bacterium]
MRLRSVNILLALSLALSGCGNTHATIAEWFGASDRVEPAPVTIDILCDPSSGSTCTERSLREVVEGALRSVVNRPGSLVRLWMQGRNIETTRMIAEARSGKPRGTGRRARADYEIRWRTNALASLSGASDTIVRKRVHRSPIAEAIGVIALAPPATASTRELIVISDGMEVSDYGEFECARLPKPERFVRSLARSRVLPPGSLRGVSVRFCHFDLGAIDRGRCAVSLARASQIRDLWRAVLAAAGASSIEIRQGGFDPSTAPRKDSPDA